MRNLLNVASWDRIVRVALGIAMIIVGFCPLYFVFKFRALKKTLTARSESHHAR